MLFLLLSPFSEQFIEDFIKKFNKYARFINYFRILRIKKLDLNEMDLLYLLKLKKDDEEEIKRNYLKKIFYRISLFFFYFYLIIKYIIFIF